MGITETSSTSFYDYQKKDIQKILNAIQGNENCRLLYQLPTGGGKTVVFSEIARKYIQDNNKAVLILTHRQELSKQTSATLKKLNVPNKIINSTTKNFKDNSLCYVAMVETLRNRIKSKKISTKFIGLVIVDEAHHNSFRKLFRNFKNATIVGVTATPFSSDITKPMNHYYDSLLMGESISNLITKGFLAEPKTYVHEVELNSLKTGIHGDFTVNSSNELYGSEVMLDLLVTSYKENCVDKKTLIFNNGISVSKLVENRFSKEGIPIKHLDNTMSDEERKKLLKWFKKTKNAVVTSVSILTTGFDEPTIEHIILNRATTSITLYHQMIGRGARRLTNKLSFGITDLGNNVSRFGPWEAPMDWKHIFEKPIDFAKEIQFNPTINSFQSHAISKELRAQFPKTLEMAFDIDSHYHEALDLHKKPKTIIQESIRQQVKMCIDNSDSLSKALSLAEQLAPEIDWRVKQYVKCLDKASKSYKEWLLNDYTSRLKNLLIKLYPKFHHQI
jgi:superfamily II DNA or RNA helicase